jgi:hypothetical protein
MHANGGVPQWRSRHRMLFEDYNQLANGVLKALEIEMPQIDVSGLRGFAPFRLWRQQPRTPGGEQAAPYAPQDGAPAPEATPGAPAS